MPPDKENSEVRKRTQTQPIRIGIDVGGTFTDVLLIDSSGNRWHVKNRSTPEDSSQGVLQGLREVLQQAQIAPNQIRYLLHGTTIATNAVLQRRGSNTSLIVTKGFEDLLEIGRQQRPSLYDLFVDRIPPLVPREHCWGVSERTSAEGQILTPLTNTETRRVAKTAGKGMDAVAVCLLFSYANPTHERIIHQQLQTLYPNLTISLSSSVLPEYREFERLSTTVLDAFVSPITSQYLHNLEEVLSTVGVKVPLLLMQSHGGVLQSPIARKQAVRLLFSGLAGGALGGRYTSQVMKQNNLITFDMGGTSTDVALISEGVIHETSEGQIGGLPCRTPMLDVKTVGAGGGSIAWIDDGGVLRVGPQSAGADPGPCCYNMGGVSPTVTDANLLLGRLNPTYFLGGKIPLNLNPAQKFIHKLAKHLTLSDEECAFGIIRVVNANMERAIRLVSIQRGFDPRDFGLVAFGGAGPMHAWALAEDLGIPKVIVPFAPGLHSALGLLATHLRSDQSQTVLQSSKNPDFKQINSTLKNLEQKTRELLKEQGVKDSQIRIQRQADLRYEGQAYELTLQSPPGAINHKWLDALIASFYKYHKQRYGYAAAEASVTIVNLRVLAIGPMPSLQVQKLPPQGKQAPQPKDTRPVYFEKEGFVETPIYERLSLGANTKLLGPSIIEQPDSTTVVPPTVKAVVHESGNLLLEALK